MKEEIIDTDDNIQIDNTDRLNGIIDDESININNEDVDFIEEFDDNNKKRLHSGIKLALILVATGIVGFMFSGILMSFANWIIFN